VSLWTRLAPEPLVEGGGVPAKDIGVRWQVASDSNFRHVVKSGKVAAMPELGHSVHVDVNGLRSGREYFYRFLTDGDESPVGRTKTAPGSHDRVRDLTFAFASCQKWDDGFYAPYRGMADEDIELVIHLGDYIYEYGVGSGGVRNANIPASFGPECVTLERYRLQHSLYKTDPDLQEAHRLSPWMVTWDDHEVANDYSGIYPEFANTSPEFLARRAAAYQAYFENMPVPLSATPKKGAVQLYRRLEYGDIAQFNMLDTRQYRTDNPCGDGEQAPCDAGFDPDATMTGKAQEKWLLKGLEHSRARWNVIANGVLMVNDLKADYEDEDAPVVATEFAGTSISSNGDCICYGPYYGPMIDFNPDIKFFDGDRRGYVLCKLDHDEWRTDLRMVPTVSTPDAPVSTFASFVVQAGQPGAQKV
jgi:alkaline phosphatase D